MMADVAKAEKQSKPDEPLNIVGALTKRPELFTSSATTGAEQQAERRGRKRAERKTLEHFVHGNHQPAKTEAHHHADQAAMLIPIYSGRTC